LARRRDSRFKSPGIWVPLLPMEILPGWKPKRIPARCML